MLVAASLARCLSELLLESLGMAPVLILHAEADAYWAEVACRLVAGSHQCVCHDHAGNVVEFAYPTPD